MVLSLFQLIIATFVVACTEGGKNVLFLVSDDMRQQLSCYDGPDFPSPVHPKMHTPNLDRLASRSLLLKRAYVQQAVCSPSRTSVLTGRRPDTTHVYDLHTYFRKSGGNFTTLPEYFKQQGYRSIGMGKIFHPGVASGYDDPVSWSEPYFHAPNLQHYNSRKHSWRAVSEEERRKRPLPDEQIATHAIKTLRRVAPEAKSGGRPFFVAVGFHKPHLPFVFPEEFLSFYPKSVVRLPNNPHVPADMPRVAWYPWGGIRGYKDIKELNATGKFNTTMPDFKTLQLRRAYYSAISYTDALVGEVLNELEKLGLDNDTIVSFFGDHGWQLGEHGEWAKRTNFELATHAPMMIRIPGQTDHGIATESLAELVDLFPTLVEAAGLPKLSICPVQSSNITLCTEGASLMSLVKNPGGHWKHLAFSQYPRTVGNTPVMGYTMRTERFRYTEWAKFQGAPVYKPDWNTLFGIELYDHMVDPNENVNVAGQPKYSAMRKQLSKDLHLGWRAALV